MELRELMKYTICICSAHMVSEITEHLLILMVIMKHIQAYLLFRMALLPMYLGSRCGSSVRCSLASFGSELCTLGGCVRRRLDGGQQGCQSMVPGTNLCFCPPPPPPPHPLLLTAARGVIAMTRTTVQLPLG